MQILTRLCLGTIFAGVAAPATFSNVTTLVGTGKPGYSETQLNNPYGMTIGPDGALYVCEVDNHRVRRIDLKTRRMALIAGNGQRGYSGDGSLAVEFTQCAP
jgi:DNA-binding beta-propeller fold protein YncE